jgi:uncharacterized lipoprotein NlpE involved in copper resistance
MKKAVLAVLLLNLTISGCNKKTETDPNPVWSDPTVTELSKKLSESEKELKNIEKSFLEAQKRYYDAKATFSDTSDLKISYYAQKEKLDIARRDYFYYKYKLKYEKLTAQKRYLEKWLKNSNNGK